MPMVDMADPEDPRRTIVDYVPGAYLGQPDSVLMDDGRTIFAVYPLGHAAGATVLKKSEDGGRTWSDRLPVPEDWARTKEVPTIHRLHDADGVERLIVFQNFEREQLSQAISEDGGATWTAFAPNGIAGHVAPNTVVPLGPAGRYLTVVQFGGEIFRYITNDGGRTWGGRSRIASYPGARLTEPAAFWSPDKSQIAVLIRENTRNYNSMLVVSHDRGETWSSPVEVSRCLTGDRHMPRYAPDGRLVIAFRDKVEGSPTFGDFLLWVGTYEDVLQGGNGAYRVRLVENLRKSGDTGYAGLELLPNGEFVATTYAPLQKGERPAVISIRFRMEELDALAKSGPPAFLSDAPFFEVQELFPGERFPNVTVATDGSILAFKTNDAPARLRRSVDGGKTWSDIIEMGDIGMGAAVVDENTGDVLALLYHEQGRGYGSKFHPVSKIYRSQDHGVTWTIEDVVLHPDAWGRIGVTQGSESGITLRRGPHRGRLLAAARVFGLEGENHSDTWNYSYSTAIYSDDGGRSWRTSDPFPVLGTGEGALAELSDGRIYYNSRSHTATDAMRRIAFSEDGGVTWLNSRRSDTLPDGMRGTPYGCMAGLVRLPGESEDVLLYSNLDSAEGYDLSRGRRNITVWASFDGGETWPVKRLIYGGPSAYSSLAAGRPGTPGEGMIYLMFEGGDEGQYSAIQMARFNLAWLTGGTDRVN